MIAALTRRLGASHLDVIENALQDAALRAFERWEREGVPDSIEGWLVRVAHNLALDAMRRDGRLVPLPADYDREGAPAPSVDDDLRLMFLCCHPSLSRAAQVALTLKIACGFTVPQIAQAFLTAEKTLAQRIARAKQRLREERARFELPEPDPPASIRSWMCST